MGRVFYLPLESYEERYTFQLRKWTEDRLRARGVETVVVEGIPTTGEIRTGVALDAHGRCIWSLTQMATMVEYLQYWNASRNDVIYAQDLFHPGWEALPYILQQLPPHRRPYLYNHLLAQSIDPNDFTFPMRHWMRHYELMVDKTMTGHFVASTCMVDMMRAALFEARIHVVGLPFDRDEVRSRVPAIKPWEVRQRRVVFSSRFDREKQPHFFMDVVAMTRTDPFFNGVEFAVLTGAKELRSNDPSALERLRELAATGHITIYEGLTKNRYYDLLADSQAHFNCALQDFVSNTLNEASALGTPSLLPAYLSFPEAVGHNYRHLYTPWSRYHAYSQLSSILADPPLESVPYASLQQHRTLDLVIDHLAGRAPRE